MYCIDCLIKPTNLQTNKSNDNTESLSTIHLSVLLNGIQIIAKLSSSIQVVHQSVQIHNIHHREAKVLLNLLHSAQVTRIALLLAVQSDHQTYHLTTLRINDRHRLTCGRSSSNHIIDHQHTLVLQRASDNAASLAVVLSLLAVKEKRLVDTMNSCQRAG